MSGAVALHGAWAVVFFLFQDIVLCFGGVTCLGQLRCQGQNLFQEFDCLFEQSLVRGSCVAWGRTFPIVCLNKSLVWDSCVVWAVVLCLFLISIRSYVATQLRSHLATKLHSYVAT